MYQKITNSEKIYVCYYYKKGKGFTNVHLSVNKQVKYRDIIELFKGKDIDGVGVRYKSDGDIVELDYTAFINVYMSLDVFFDITVLDVIKKVYLLTGYKVGRDVVMYAMHSKLPATSSYRVDGEYLSADAKIFIRMSLVREAYNTPVNRNLLGKVKSVLYHEIGHYIHYTYFKDADVGIHLRRGNHMETFANAFESLMVCLENGDSLSNVNIQMQSILKKRKCGEFEW